MTLVIERHSLLLTVVFLGAVSACGNSEPRPPSQEPSDPDLATKIELVKADILADTCFLEQEDVSVCDWGEFSFDPSQFAMKHNTGETILIVDDFRSLPVRAIRYKNRIKGFLRVNSAGMITPVPFAWRVPTRLFHALSSFASSDFIPAETLHPLKTPLEAVYGSFDAENLGHGSFVFSLLIEANPHQPFVLMDMPNFHQFAFEELCDIAGTPESIDRLRTKAQRVADDIRRVMSEMNVRFINLSAGETLDSLREEWMGHCEGTMPSEEILRAKLNAYSPIVEALFNTPGVFAAHASINASSPEDFPFDFPTSAYPNRMLVGYFTALDAGLDAMGRGDHSGLSGWPSSQNVDIYLNSGVLPTRPFPYNSTPLLQVDGFGVDIFPIANTTTSWIAPLALSQFISIRYSIGCELSNAFERAELAPVVPDVCCEPEMSNDFIARLRGVMVPRECADLPESRCIYQDPLKHGKIEAIRLGYRPLEYVEP